MSNGKTSQYIANTKPSHNDGMNQPADQFRKSKYEEREVPPPGGLGTAKTYTAPEDSKGGKPIENINKLFRSSTLILMILGMALVSAVSARTVGNQYYINTKVLGQNHKDGL
ncbi:hypothetical protein E3Q23_03153 [Wallemia mellicola]|uniref:Uncharacterized protein n=1 Tax=Wallemia mellicola TaxID=1708541 RepID=A0A4T0RMK8_9BASI|nr:hypothetical protein E3Q23_03153 [Wallemia mellicola]TIB82612.1 hypothetical protein E3Q21_03323 [Wallemia mellicola]TIB85351.1 hypothetical protein E3Q20_03318 [Wallemia mellicola]TIC39050.1 hypothetical protein E3Q07_03424 [Wallemia mellicola]TIC47039.1 hypothetical protein E3Q06_03355 [Wallemia mellicola]